MKMKKYRIKSTFTRIPLALLGVLLMITSNSKGQDGYKFGISLQGGPNIFMSDAYPEDITSSSFAATFDYKMYDWIGLIGKLENGGLSGTKKFKSGNTPYSVQANYTLFSTLGYIHATNIIFGVNEDRWIDIKVIGGPGFISSRYDVTYEQDPETNNRKGTSNALALSAGGIMELHFADQFSFILELNGIADFSNSIDGVWDTNQGAAEYKGYDIVATFEAGIKYRFGGDNSSGGKRKGGSKQTQAKQLPSQYKGFRGFDGMENSRVPKY